MIKHNGQALLAAKYVLKNWVALKPGEKVMILADTEADQNIIKAFMAATMFMDAEPTVVVMPPSFQEFERYPTRIALKAMEEADVFIPVTPTTGHAVHSLENAKLKWEKKIRIWHMGWHAGGINDIVEALRLGHDYEEVWRISRRLADIMTAGKKARLTTPAGTDLTCSIDGITYRVNSALAREPGESGCVPSGECWAGPAEGTGEGVLILDGPIALCCDSPTGPKTPIRVEIKQGRVASIEGVGPEYEKLKFLIEKNPNADNLAELSIGTNPFLKMTGDVNRNDKRVLGTVHVAFGQNIYQIYPMGTVDSPIHMDAVLPRPTLEIDNEIILKDGKIV